MIPKPSDTFWDTLDDIFPTPPFSGLVLFGTVTSSGLSLSTISCQRPPSRDGTLLAVEYSSLENGSREGLLSSVVYGFYVYVFRLGCEQCPRSRPSDQWGCFSISVVTLLERVRRWELLVSYCYDR